MIMSSSEAQWVAFSDTVKEVMFIAKLLQSKKISVELLITVRVDNVRAIFMARIVTATSHTKCVKISNNYMNDYLEASIVKIVIVKSTKMTVTFSPKS